MENKEWEVTRDNQAMNTRRKNPASTEPIFTGGDIDSTIPNKMTEVDKIIEKLKEQWEPYHNGKCYILSEALGKGKCSCHLCLLDNIKPAIQAYLAQEIKRRKLIPITDAVKYVEIDRDKLDNRLFDCQDVLSFSEIVDMADKAFNDKNFNPLKLKQ